MAKIELITCLNWSENNLLRGIILIDYVVYAIKVVS